MRLGSNRTTVALAVADGSFLLSAGGVLVVLLFLGVRLSAGGSPALVIPCAFSSRSAGETLVVHPH